MSGLAKAKKCLVNNHIYVSLRGSDMVYIQYTVQYSVGEKGLEGANIFNRSINGKGPLIKIMRDESTITSGY